MRTVNFKKVTMENFCCYKNMIDYEFKNDKIILVTGPNGVGKSSIFAALPYTLYGTTPSGLKGDDVVNNEVGKNCYTSLEFSIDSSEYLCERYAKNSKLGNSATLKKDGVLIKKGHTEVVAEIERILIPQKLFFNTLLFGQKVKTFFTDLTDSDQKDIFRKVLQLDDYMLYYDKSSDYLKEIKKDAEKILGDINLTNGLIENLKTQISQLKESEVRFGETKKSELKQLTDELKKVESNLSDLNLALSDFGDNDLDGEYNKLKDELNSFRNSIEVMKGNRESALKDAQVKRTEKETSIKTEYSLKMLEIKSTKDFDINVIKTKHQENLKTLEIDLVTLKNNIENIRSEYQSKSKEYNNLIDEIKVLNTNLSADLIICPLCKQEIGKDNLYHLQNELSQKQEKETSLKSEIEKLKVSGVSLKGTIAIIEENIKIITDTTSSVIDEVSNQYSVSEKEYKDKLGSVLNQIEEIFKKMIASITNEFKDKISDLETEISLVGFKIDEILKKAKMKNDTINQIKTLENNIQTINHLISSKASLKFDDTVLKQSEKKKVELQTKLTELNNSSKEKEELTDIYDFWKTGFSMSGIPSMLIDEAIPFMNERIGFYLDQIGGRYIVSFDTLNKNKGGEFKDKIAVNVYDTITKANMRKQLSGGQTRIVDIATILTLRDLQSNIQDMKTNIIILDEIFDSLDSKNIEYVSTVLRKMTKGNSINIISHTQIDQLDVDETLRFM